MALYITNGIGINSIEDGWPIPAGWSIMDATEAEAKDPALFGAPTDEFGNVIAPASVATPTDDTSSSTKASTK